MRVRYAELAFTVAAEEADHFAAVLHEAGAAGVEVRDGDTLDKAPPGSTVLVVWVAPEAAEDMVARVGLPVLRRQRDEDEWRELWKKFFTPRKVGRFVIVPSWEKYSAADGELRLDLDPGRAFGTGQHASTRLCLELIGGVPSLASFLDVGCGSGVLAIACKKAWPAARGAAMDLDPDAVDVSRENSERNSTPLALSTTLPDGKFDLVVANIQPEVLIPLAPELTARVGGKLILSGILVEAADSVVAAYPSLQLVETRDDDGWRALMLTVNR